MGLVKSEDLKNDASVYNIVSCIIIPSRPGFDGTVLVVVVVAGVVARVVALAVAVVVVGG
jgi:hypothetical protein